jgi:RNA polymerase sigma-70 factor (ECF subfamily)
MKSYHPEGWWPYKETTASNMDSGASGHLPSVMPLSAAVGERAPSGHDLGRASRPAGLPAVHSTPAAHVDCVALSFDAVYDEHVDFVWRSLRSLGVRDHTLEDAVQDVFVVVHRRLAEFEQRSTLRTWIFGIAMRVAHDHRRREGRKGGLAPLDFELYDRAPSPDDRAAQTEALREVAQVLETLDPDKRAVFVLAEVEQWTAPEIAEALGINLNTVYSRIRAARREFEAAYARRKDERK